MSSRTLRLPPKAAAPTLAGGIATCTVSSATLLAVGSYVVVAIYSGDTNFTTSSTFGFLTVAAAATTTTVTVSPTSVALGHETTATFTPTLTATPASAGTPTGTVTLTATNTVTSVATTLCTVPAANADGSHPCSVANAALLTTGSYTITAAYPGDANFTGSTGTAVGTFTVTPAAASSLTLTLTPSSTSVAYGNESAVTYDVSLGSVNPIPTGTVTIRTGATTLCTITLTPASANVGSCSPADRALAVPGSPYSLTATYPGDANFTGSVSSAQTLTVTRATTATALTETLATVVVGQETAATFTPIVTVTPVAAGAHSG